MSSHALLMILILISPLDYRTDQVIRSKSAMAIYIPMI